MNIIESRINIDFGKIYFLNILMMLNKILIQWFWFDVTTRSQNIDSFNIILYKKFTHCYWCLEFNVLSSLISSHYLDDSIAITCHHFIKRMMSHGRPIIVKPSNKRSMFTKSNATLKSILAMRAILPESSALLINAALDVLFVLSNRVALRQLGRLCFHFGFPSSS